MSVKLMQKRISAIFYVKELLQDRVSALMFSIILGMIFWKEFQFFWWWPEDLLCHAYMCVSLTTGLMPCAAPHACYIECVYIAGYKYAALGRELVS